MSQDQTCAHHANLLPCFITALEHNCPVCIGLLDEEDEVKTMPCGHKFHSSCLLPWLEKVKYKVHVSHKIWLFTNIYVKIKSFIAQSHKMAISLYGRFSKWPSVQFIHNFFCHKNVWSKVKNVNYSSQLMFNNVLYCPSYSLSCSVKKKVQLWMFWMLTYFKKEEKSHIEKYRIKMRKRYLHKSLTFKCIIVTETTERIFIVIHW